MNAFDCIVANTIRGKTISEIPFLIADLLAANPHRRRVICTPNNTTSITRSSPNSRFGGIPQTNLNGAIMMRLSRVSRVASSQGIASPVGVNRLLVLVVFFFMVAGVFLPGFDGRVP